MICQWFDLKTIGTLFSGLASKSVAAIFFNLSSKPVAMVSFGLALKSVTTGSPGLVSKPVVVFLVEPQNQGCGGFSGLSLKIGSYCLVFWVSKSQR
jgi:hypothetical protein